MPVSEDFLIFEDLETTGLRFGHDEAIEIASILTDWDLNEVARFHEKIQFDVNKMTPEAAEKNGYDPKAWSAEAVPFYKYEAWMERHIKFGQVAVPVGHRAEFDRRILEERYFKPAAKFFKWSYRMIDTCQLAMCLKVAKVITVPDVKLETVANALGIKPSGEFHRAMADCEVSKKIFEFCVGVFQS